jgi:hypothetical protein
MGVPHPSLIAVLATATTLCLGCKDKGPDGDTGTSNVVDPLNSMRIDHKTEGMPSGWTSTSLPSSITAMPAR